jgi:hypothetical protein
MHRLPSSSGDWCVLNAGVIVFELIAMSFKTLIDTQINSRTASFGSAKTIRRSIGKFEADRKSPAQ